MVTLTVGARGKEGKGGGGGEKKNTPTRLTVSLYSLLRFRQSFGIGAAGNVACITQ